MDFQNMEAAIKNAVDSVRKTPAVRNGKNVSYAIVVKVGYEEINKLREEGYSYDIICKMFFENGLLGANASPKNFCIAYLRETKRRMSRADGHNPTMGKGNAPVKKADANLPAARTSGIVPAQRATEKRFSLEVKPDNIFNIKPILDEDEEAMAAAEKERIKRLLNLGRKVDTGLGTSIIKLPDGSFEF